jgi:hypothetical protein
VHDFELRFRASADCRPRLGSRAGFGRASYDLRKDSIGITTDAAGRVTELNLVALEFRYDPWCHDLVASIVRNVGNHLPRSEVNVLRNMGH